MKTLKFHKVLERQLKKSGFGKENLPASEKDWELFLENINNCYKQYDEDRYLLERSLDLSSKEMQEKTERNKKMSLQLIQSAKLASLGTLASGIAHELNNPLAGIMGNAQLMHLRGSLDNSQKESLETIIKLSERMGGIIKNLLKLSRQSNDVRGDFIDIQDPINDCLDLTKKQFSTDDIEINYDVKTSHTTVKADRNTLASVFQNLLSNSRDEFIKIRDNKPKIINISLEEDSENNMLLVRYRDNAGGMSNEVLNKIFDPFFTTKGVDQGTGLGMAISKQIIEELGGDIKVFTTEGVGSEFLICLPNSIRREIESQQVVRSLDKTSPEIRVPKFMKEEKPKVLIVDDEEFVCQYLKKVLEDKFDVYSTQSPINGVKLLKEGRFDIVMTDLKMPILSGDEVAKNVKKYMPAASLIFISGHVDEDDINQRLEGFYPCTFLTKPFPEPEKILNLLCNLKQRFIA